MHRLPPALLVLILVGIATTATQFSVQAGPAPTGSGPAWASLSPVPHVSPIPGFGGVEGMSVAGVGNHIIAALGFDPFFGDTDTTRIYDISSDTWFLGSPAPGMSSEGAGISHGRFFYSLGGRMVGAGAPPRADLWAYDPVTDTWSARAPMPTPRAGLAVANVGNSIFAIGGRSGTGGPCSGGALATVERYNIASDAWTTVAPLPAPRSDLAAAVVGNDIYVFGGCNVIGTIVGDVDVYDAVTNTWSTAPADMPTARAAMYAVANKGGTVYVIGGWDGASPGLSTNESYKASHDLWMTGLLPMPTARAETGAVGHGGRIYIVGGGTPGFGLSVDAHEVFKP